MKWARETTQPALELVLPSLSGPAAWLTPSYSRTRPQEGKEGKEGMSITPDIPLQRTRHSNCLIFTPEQGRGFIPISQKRKQMHRKGKHGLFLLPSFNPKLGLRAPHIEVSRSRPLTKELVGEASREGTGPGHLPQA